MGHLLGWHRSPIEVTLLVSQAVSQAVSESTAFHYLPNGVSV